MRLSKAVGSWGRHLSADNSRPVSSAHGRPPLFDPQLSTWANRPQKQRHAWTNGALHDTARYLLRNCGQISQRQSTSAILAFKQGLLETSPVPVNSN
jgi:hypothetical protein